MKCQLRFLYVSGKMTQQVCIYELQKARNVHKMGLHANQRLEMKRKCLHFKINKVFFLICMISNKNIFKNVPAFVKMALQSDIHTPNKLTM